MILEGIPPSPSLKFPYSQTALELLNLSYFSHKNAMNGVANKHTVYFSMQKEASHQCIQINKII